MNRRSDSWRKSLAAAPLVCLISLCASAAPSAGGPTLDVTSEAVQLHKGDLALPVSLTCPKLTIDGASVGGVAKPASVQGDIAKGQTLELTYAPLALSDGAALEVKVHIDWSAEEGVLRKSAALRMAPGSSGRVLQEVILGDLDVSEKHAQMAPGDVQSYPAFLDGFFAGIEFPVAATRIEANHLLLAHRPGVTLQPGVSYETRKAVIGVAPRGEEKRAFQTYIARHRPQPTGIHVNYNSWWTSPVPYKEQDILKLMAVFKDQLYTPYHQSFDTFCIDMGWSNARSLWEIDPALFPGGFGKLDEAAKSMGCRLGLWISPSSCYPPALDNTWAAEQGFETFSVPGAGGQPFRYACLGGKRYQQAFQDRLINMATKYGVRHFKLDGYMFTCPELGHGHAPGALSSEAIADGIIAAAEAVRKVAPDVWFEPTCFGLNPSPWWLFHFNSVIGSFGDDAPFGRAPAPVYRETYTTARDFFNLQGANWSTLPAASQEVLGIIHQTPEPFMNDAVMTVMRGNMFLPVYLNPAHMTDARWKSFAALLAWARANAEQLQVSEPILPASWQDGKCPKFTNNAVMPREPYGYAHWKDGKGLIVARNPWLERKSISFVVGGAAKTDASSTEVRTVMSLYPEPRVYARSAKAGQPFFVSLAPYETVVLSIGADELPTELPTADPSTSVLRVTSNSSNVSRLEFDGGAEKFGPDWTCPLANVASGVQVDLECEIEIGSPQAELLALCDGGGTPSALGCRVEVDGSAALVETTDSETGWGASGMPRPERWTFYRTRLANGHHRIKANFSGGAETGKFSIWVWATKPASADALPVSNVLPSPETISLDSVALLAPVDLASKELKTVRAPRPLERINGVYLDTLTPASVTQGYGTLQKNQSVWEKPFIIAGKHFDRGLGTHAASRITYQLDGTYKRFQCWAGADSATGPTVTFEVYVDGQKRWESGLMDRSTPAKQVDVDIAQAKTLELVVGDGGNGIGADHADWADARLVK
ncbi:MAG: NPCBM/NEW2 domain-containing protein [Candidatus Hydrogenedentes bacterium]|nr:NPCBM/NEW2 domain-containing protein [Candidatus Hydrogenedentota bacterium]